MYPNGLDPAPIAAVPGAGHTWVARVRPEAFDPAAARVLELGHVGDDGSFTAHDVVATAGTASDVALAADGYGALWLAWLDSSGAWLERLKCR
jgi:hypothetical protein